jgi:hypothetical protein
LHRFSGADVGCLGGYLIYSVVAWGFLCGHMDVLGVYTGFLCGHMDVLGFYTGFLCGHMDVLRVYTGFLGVIWVSSVLYGFPRCYKDFLVAFMDLCSQKQISLF